MLEEEDAHPEDVELGKRSALQRRVFLDMLRSGDVSVIFLSVMYFSY